MPRSLSLGRHWAQDGCQIATSLLELGLGRRRLHWWSGDRGTKVAAVMEALGVNPPSHAVHLNVVDVLVVLQDHTVAGRDRSVDAVANSHSVVLYVDARLSTGHRKLQMQLARIAKPIMCEVGGGVRYQDCC